MRLLTSVLLHPEPAIDHVYKDYKTTAIQGMKFGLDFSVLGSTSSNVLGLNRGIFVLMANWAIVIHNSSTLPHPRRLSSWNNPLHV